MTAPPTTTDYEKLARQAVLLLNDAKYEEGVACLDELLKKFPKYIDGWYNRGIALSQHLSRHEEAIKCFDQALRVMVELYGRDDDIDLWHNRGKALYSLGRYQEAVESFNKVLAHKPNHRISIEGKAASLNNMGYYKEAIETAEIIIKLYPPGNPRTWKALSIKAMALNNLGKYKQAIAVVNRALEVNPKDDGIWQTKGHSLASLGKYREALMCLEEAIRLNPNNAEAKELKEKIAEMVEDFWGE